MKKILTLLILTTIFCQSAFASTNKEFMTQKEVEEYSKYIDEPQEVQDARQAAFQDVEYQINVTPFKKYFVDKNFIAPPKKQGDVPKIKHFWGILTVYSNGLYDILYFKNLNYVFIYSSQTGELAYIAIPQKYENGLIEYVYNINGYLKYVLFIEKFLKGKD